METDSSFQGICKSDFQLYELLESMFRFAIIYSEIYERGIAPDSVQYKQAVKLGLSLLNEKMKECFSQSIDKGLLSKLFEGTTDIQQETPLDKKEFVSRMRHTDCSWIFTERLVRERVMDLGEDWDM